MTVLTLTNSPPKLTGDLTKWMLEIDIGVYVGNLNARVREAVWQRVCDNIGDGKAVMVYSSNSEQKMKFCVCNSTRQPVDYDGITLIKKPLPKKTEKKTISSKQSKVKKKIKKEVIKKQIITDFPKSYVILDLETTGLRSQECEITEIGLLRIEDGVCVDEFQALLKTQNPIPKEITELTGITDEMIKGHGIDATEGLLRCFEFIGDSVVLAFHSSFEKSFLKSACERYGIEYPELSFTDARAIIKTKITGLDSYKLILIAKHLGVSSDQNHRALDDCKLLYSVVCKLNEKNCD